MVVLSIIAAGLTARRANGQSIRIPWSGYAHDPQHNALSPTASQPLNRILWSTPVDLNQQYTANGDLAIHYGSPVITLSNTVVVPVKTGAYGGFQVEGHAGTNGALLWTLPTDYILPAHDWTPSFGPALTPKNRVYFAGAGGTVLYCDTPDTTNSPPACGRLAFYGMTNFLADSNTYINNVFIDTPITSDRYGNIFFGFAVTGPTSANLAGGLARIDFNGTGSWISASNLATDGGMLKAAMNCTPALSPDQRIVYIAVNNVQPMEGFNLQEYGYITAADSRTLAPLGRIVLLDAQSPSYSARVVDDSSASPSVGPDGDVYIGVLEAILFDNHDRGWLLHYDSTLSVTKIPGAFGWDDTASVVPSGMVPSYTGSSKYLLMTKYNNYAGDWGAGGDGVNKIAILDPNNTETDPITGATVMNEVLTIVGPTPDLDDRADGYTNAVKEWCINSAAVDPATKSVLANSEDGKLYRWDLTSNTLSQTNVLTSGVGEAYTPTLIGVDGVVYAINNSILWAIGR